MMIWSLLTLPLSRLLLLLMMLMLMLMLMLLPTALTLHIVQLLAWAAKADGGMELLMMMVMMVLLAVGR